MHIIGPVFPGSVICPKSWGIKPIDYSRAQEFCLYLAITESFFLCPKAGRFLGGRKGHCWQASSQKNCQKLWE